MSQTFRQLAEKVARHGLAVDERPRPIYKLAEKVCKVSQSHFYNLLLGTKGASEEAIEKIIAGFQSIDEKITEGQVREAIKRTRALRALKV